MLRRIFQLTLVGALVMFSQESLCKGELPTYTLPLSLVGGPSSVGLTTTLTAGVDILSHQGERSTFLVTVTEYDSSQHIRWTYTFRHLNLGDEISVHGIVYRVSSIKYANESDASLAASDQASHSTKGPKLSAVGICNSHCDDFVNVTKTGELISGAGAESIVLTNSHLNTLYFGECNVGVTLIGVKGDPINGYVATIKWQKLGYDSRGKGICGVVKSTNFTKTFVGREINFPGAGRFMVASILSAAINHGDWVVIVPVIE
ncbi:MAG: hypothetical protein WA777_13675 [Rhodanobacter sp.]